MPLSLGTHYKCVRAEQVRETCGSQGTSFCHCQAMEDGDYGLASWHGTIAYVNYQAGHHRLHS